MFVFSCTRRSSQASQSILSNFRFTMSQPRKPVVYASIELAYTIDGKTPGTKDVVTNFETKAPEQTKNLHIKAADPEFAGEYSGTLIFALAFALCTACAVSALAADATSGTMNPTSGATEITTSIKPLRISFSTKGRKLHAGLRRHKKRRGGFYIRPCPLAAG